MCKYFGSYIVNPTFNTVYIIMWLTYDTDSDITIGTVQDIRLKIKININLIACKASTKTIIKTKITSFVHDLKIYYKDLQEQ